LYDARSTTPACGNSRIGFGNGRGRFLGRLGRFGSSVIERVGGVPTISTI